MCDDQLGLIKTRFLLAVDALIRLEVEPGVDQAADRVPTSSLESARNTLLGQAELGAAEVGGGQLLEGLMFRLSEAVASNVASPPRLAAARGSVGKSLGAGMAPSEIATLLEKSLRGGQPNGFLFEREAGLPHLPGQRVQVVRQLRDRAGEFPKRIPP